MQPFGTRNGSLTNTNWNLRFCTIFALFYFEFERNSEYKLLGACIWRGDLNIWRFFTLRDCGAHILRGLYMYGRIFGTLRSVKKPSFPRDSLEVISDRRFFTFCFNFNTSKYYNVPKRRNIFRQTSVIFGVTIENNLTWIYRAITHSIGSNAL